MWFIAGMMLGSALSSDGSAAKLPGSLGDIPFRCFVALDESDESYRNCRRLSMTLQLTQQISNTNEDYSGYKRGSLRVLVDDAMNLEVRGLRKLEEAALAAKPAGK